MIATLRGAGFTLDELGELPLQSWSELFGAVVSLRMQSMSLLMAALHPKHPARQQRKFMRAAAEAMGAQKGKPIWQDPQRFKRWLTGMPGVVVDDDQQDHGKTEKE